VIHKIINTFKNFKTSQKIAMLVLMTVIPLSIALSISAINQYTNKSLCFLGNTYDI